MPPNSGQHGNDLVPWPGFTNCYFFCFALSVFSTCLQSLARLTVLESVHVSKGISRTNISLSLLARQDIMVIFIKESLIFLLRRVLIVRSLGVSVLSVSFLTHSNFSESSKSDEGDLESFRSFTTTR